MVRCSDVSCAPLSRGLDSGEADVWDLVRPERSSLARLRQASVRSGAWFTAISWEQRRFLDVVIRTVDRIRSRLLLSVLAPLVRKLLVTGGGDARNGALSLMSREALNIVKGIAEKIVKVAQSWGNRAASEWLNEGFLRFLLVMNLPQNGS